MKGTVNRVNECLFCITGAVNRSSKGNNKVVCLSYKEWSFKFQNPCSHCWISDTVQGDREPWCITKQVNMCAESEEENHKESAVQTRHLGTHWTHHLNGTCFSWSRDAGRAGNLSSQRSHVLTLLISMEHWAAFPSLFAHLPNVLSATHWIMSL